MSNNNKKTYRNLVSEARRKKDTIVVGWGRFNPPTVGHEKLIEKVAAEAQGRGADYRIYPTKTSDAKKNPLSFPQKVKFMRAMFTRHARNISPDKKLNTIIKAAQALDKEGYANLVLVAGSDRLREFKTLLSNYNGKEYNFDKIDVVSAGERDPDAEGVTGMSASKMRAAAASNDFKSFRQGVPRGFRQAKALFDSVRKGMNISEELDEAFEEEMIDELTSKQKAKLDAAGADVAVKSLKTRKKHKLDPDSNKEIEFKTSDYGYVGGPRFNRLLRFGLSPEGTSDIPLTKRAFKDMHKAGSTPIMRSKIFRVTQKTFDYLLEDDILYNRFVILLHRKEIFGEDTMKTFNDLSTDLLHETAGTSVLPDTPEHPEHMNYVATFSTPTMAKSFINLMTNSKLGGVTWVSSDGTEIQFQAYKSSAGHVVRSQLVGRHRAPKNASQLAAGSDIRLVDIIAKFGGSLHKFEGDVREGLVADGPIDELTEGLRKRAERAEVPYDIVAEVYARGLQDWERNSDTGDSTPNQWAFARVNSFLSGGKTITEDDADLWEECLERQPVSEMDDLFDNEFEMTEKSPPSAEAERFIKKSKEGFKKSYGDNWKNALYATAWKMHKKHWEEIDPDEVNEDFDNEFSEINESFEKEITI